MRPLTILLVGAFPFPLHQGSQVHVAGQARALAARGHRVLLACYAHGLGDPPQGVEIVRGEAVPGGSVERSGPHWSRLPQDLSLWRTIRRILCRERVDIVHAHNVEAPLLARLAGARPLLFEQHTEMAAELPSYVRRGRRLAGAVGTALDWLVPRTADHCIALSEHGRSALQRVGVRQVTVLPPAVDLADLQGADADRARRRWQLGDRDWVVYAGNTDAYQDLPDWFEAMRWVPEAGLLLVTGSDPAPWRERAARMGLDAKVVQTRDFADVKDALAAAAVAVSPRSVCAGFPIKLLNQLGLGVLTVAAQGSARDIEGVYPVPNRDPQAMAAALRAVLADPQREARGARARAEIERHWSWPVRAAELEQVYARVLPEGRGA